MEVAPPVEAANETEAPGPAPEVIPPVPAPATAPAKPIAPIEAPVAEALDVVAPVPVADAPAAVPTLAPEAMAPEGIIPSAVIEPPAAAPAAATNTAPAGELEKLLYSPPGVCPKIPIEYVPAGKHEAELTPPDGAIATYGDKVGANGKFPLPYDTVKNGDAYCVADTVPPTPRVTIGGTFLFEGKDGTCYGPPVTAAGESCCTIYMWQPNSNGFYYDNCSMKCVLFPLRMLLQHSRQNQ